MRSTRRTRLGHALGMDISGGFLALTVLLAMLVIVVPLLAGAIPLTVLTGSMEPKLPPGTLVVVKPKPAEEIGVGEVITYQLRSGDPTVVTHRVVSVAYGSDGAPRFTTQGDANDAVDAAPVEPVQVKGAVWYAVPWIGRVGNAVDGRQRETAALHHDLTPAQRSGTRA